MTPEQAIETLRRWVDSWELVPGTLECREAIRVLADALAERDQDKSTIRDFVNALDLHKARMFALQDTLCECQMRGTFQAELHDDVCPVHMVAGVGTEAVNDLVERDRQQQRRSRLIDGNRRELIERCETYEEALHNILDDAWCDRYAKDIARAALGSVAPAEEQT